MKSPAVETSNNNNNFNNVNIEKNYYNTKLKAMLK